MKSIERGAKRAYKILVIEDGVETCELFRSALSRHFEVITAPDGATGLELVMSKRPDLILLDLVMPGISGSEVCSALRSNRSTCEIPIVVVTGSVNGKAREQALATGADEFVRKPIKPADLLDCVRSVIDRLEKRSRAS
jgi:CheY-like chemotaxis protein